MIRYVISVNNTERRIRPEDIGTTIMGFLRNVAQTNLSSPVTKTVISVPAEFDQLQRNYTRKAANNAGKVIWYSVLIIHLEETVSS
jgi:stress 70 chaperone-associated protein